MKRSELERETAERTGYAIAVCKEIIQEMWKVMTDELVGHGEVDIPRFGKFVVKDVAGRRIVTPIGDEVHVGVRKMPRFYPSTVLKDAVRK